MLAFEGNFAVSPAAIACLLAIVYHSVPAELREAIQAIVTANTATVTDDSMKISSIAYARREFTSKFRHAVESSRSLTILPPNSTGEDLDKLLDRMTNSMITTAGITGVIPFSLMFKGCAAFKGQWLTAFDPSLTATRLFRRYDKPDVEVQMMRLRSSLYISEITIGAVKFDVVEMRFATGGFFVRLMLPKTDYTDKVMAPVLLASYCTTEVWKKRLKMRCEDVALFLPRFDINVEFEDMTDFIAAQPGLSSLRNGSTYQDALVEPSDKLQVVYSMQTRVAFDEFGVKAAAVATANLYKSGSASIQKPEKPTVLNFNQPFVLAILSSHSDVMFTAVVGDPSVSSTKTHCK